MPEVVETWQWMNRDYSEMSKERYEKFKEEEKITYDEIVKWAEESGVESLEPKSGVGRRGWTGHDIEFNLKNPYNEPWDCPCRDQLKELKPEFSVPIHGFCEGCGAQFTWSEGKGEWNWLWRYNNIERVEEAPIEYLGEGVTLDGFQVMAKKVKRLEKLVKDSHGFHAHDFFKILNVPEVEVDYVKVDEIQISDDGQAKVTLESEGREYQFACSPAELMNIEEILNHWKEVVIPRKRAMEEVSIEELRESMKELEGIRV